MIMLMIMVVVLRHCQDSGGDTRASDYGGDDDYADDYLVVLRHCQASGGDTRADEWW